MSEQRDIKREGDEIKQSLTKADEFEYSFSSVIETVYDGLNPHKLDSSVITRYYPDFFYLGDIAVRLFDTLRGDRTVNKDDELCPFGFVTYLFYACFAHWSRILASSDDVDLDIIRINTIFENSGFADVPIPVIFNQWFQGVSQYTSPIFGRTFRPGVFNPVVDGIYFNNFFLSGNSAHLVPNFRALFAKAWLLSQDAAYVVPAAQRNHATFSNPNIAIQPAPFNNDVAQLFRAFNSRIPGIAHLTRRHVSPQFAALCAATLNFAFPAGANFSRYLQLRPDMLRFLATTYAPFVKKTNYFMTSKQPTAGSDILECYLTERTPQDALVAAQYNGEQPPVVVAPPIFDHIFTIRSKYRIVNGNALTASVIPVIRISVPETRVPNAIANGVDPGEIQNPYFIEAIEYETQPLTIQEAHMRFSRKK